MTTEAAPAAADAPLSLSDAAGLLGAPAVAVEPEETAPLEETAELPAEPTAEDEIDPEEAIELELEDEPDPVAPVIAAPQSWDAEARALFATLPPEAQQVIAARDSETSAAVNRAQNEASEVRKRAEAEVQSVTQLRAATEQVLTQVKTTFKGKWDNVDWAQWAQSDPAAYVAGKAQYDAEQTQLAQLQAAHQAQQATELRAFAAKKVEDLRVIMPELLDPTKGPERVSAIEKYITQDIGVDPAILHTLDAKVIQVVAKAMKYDALVAKAKSGKPTPEPARAAVRPTAATQVRTPQRIAEATRNRFAQTGSLEDAVAVLNSRQQGNGRSN